MEQEVKQTPLPKTPVKAVKTAEEMAKELAKEIAEETKKQASYKTRPV